MNAERPAFFTGSRVYGIPRTRSDVDMVVRVTEGELAMLEPLADVEYATGGTSSSSNRVISEPLRFGNLNLLCCLTDQRYDSFARARERCLLEAPVTRDRAIEIHKEERAKE